MFTEMPVLTQPSGGSDSYDTLDWVSIAANGSIPVFTTKGRAKAIWLTRYITSSPYNNKVVTYTNVNPTTGEIDNESIYDFDSSASAPVIDSVDFVVSDTEVTLSTRLTSLAHILQLIYTY